MIFLSNGETITTRQGEPAIFRQLGCLHFHVLLVDPSAKAKVRYTFPEKVDDQTMARSVPQFCFPEEQISLTWEQKRSLRFLTHKFSYPHC